MNIVEIDAKRTSITCPSCGCVDKRNRMGSKFKCARCGFELNSHYVACLDLFSRLNDGRVAIRDGRIYLSLKAGSVVPADVAPDDPAIGE
ncbi:MAG: zinc ribbon domain-containing protein [Sulfolobales archaeon]